MPTLQAAEMAVDSTDDLTADVLQDTAATYSNAQHITTCLLHCGGRSLFQLSFEFTECVA